MTSIPPSHIHASFGPDFLNMDFFKQVDSIYKSRDHDIRRIARFVKFCKDMPDLATKLETLPAPSKEKFDVVLKVYNLTQPQPENLINEPEVVPIQKKFEALEALLDVVITGHSNGLLVCGSGGIGKTYTIEQSLKKHKTKYAALKGYSSNIEFFNFLFDNRDKLVFIDDADSVFDDLIPLNILKAVLETTPHRVVSWLTPSPMLRANGTFTFTGKAIFSTNLTVEKMKCHMQALATRILWVNLAMSKEEILHRISWIAKKTDHKKIDRDTRMMIARYIRDNADIIKDLSLRTLVHSYDLYMHDPTNWRRNLRFMWAARR